MNAFTIGRSADCDLTVDDEYASPQHCLVEQQPSGYWTVTDLGSTNGTLIIRATGGATRVRAADWRLLGAGDVIVVGHTHLPPFTPPQTNPT